jgi:hypothetical protein
MKLVQYSNSKVVGSTWVMFDFNQTIVEYNPKYLSRVKLALTTTQYQMQFLDGFVKVVFKHDNLIF